MSETLSLAVPTADALIEQARTKAGLSDFGQPTYRGGLEQFLRSLKAQGRYFAQGDVDQITAGFVDKLVQRLKVEAWWAKHPELAAETPVQPLMITGLPRTGTSAFASIMSLEPALRPLRMWEQLQPVPPPTRETEAADPRRLAVKQMLEAMRETDPAQAVMHLQDIDGTEEDVFLLQLEFKAQTFTVPAYDYHAWWRDADMRPGYAYMRRCVQLLQSRRGPSRWLFKAPHYVFHLDAVVAAYPDARFVVTHRDPVKTLPSWTSLVSSLYPPGAREKTPLELIGAKVVEHQEIGMRRMVEARARLGEDRFLDVHHHDFVADPIGVLKRVYDFAGLMFEPATQARMEAWADVNRPGAHGQHKYTAAQFGMNEHAIRERFSFYTDRYGVRLEKI
jgi:hypothetical protein